MTHSIKRFIEPPEGRAPKPEACRRPSPTRIAAARRTLEDMGISIAVGSTVVELRREVAP